MFIRHAYHQISASLEAYFTLRTNMAATHAVLCVCQYILGIGDRHLSNFMIDLQTGAMVGIDFGHAFGSATQVCINMLYSLNLDKILVPPFQL